MPVVDAEMTTVRVDSEGEPGAQRPVLKIALRSGQGNPIESFLELSAIKGKRVRVLIEPEQGDLPFKKPAGDEPSEDETQPSDARQEDPPHKQRAMAKTTKRL